MWLSCGASKGVDHICKTYWSVRPVLVICLQQKLIIYVSYIRTLVKSVGPKLLDPKDEGTMILQNIREFPLRLDYGRSPHAYVNQRLQIQLELLMMSGMPLETC